MWMRQCVERRGWPGRASKECLDREENGSPRGVARRAQGRSISGGKGLSHMRRGWLLRKACENGLKHRPFARA